MYTELKSYQIIIALLKQYGISHCVLSAGSRNVPFVHSIEEDPFFKCYSVVDERSAGYFALGLAQELNQPVVISCTSSTATCNYWPPVAEAFYQGVPLIVLTSDRDPAMLGQWEDQMIDQVGMYDRHVKKSVNLPVVENKKDFWWCQRLVNEALLELDHHGKGPVHINVPMTSYNISFNVKNLPYVTKINRLETDKDLDLWSSKVEKLKQSKRILITCGQNSSVSDQLKIEMEKFFHRYNSAISVEYMSNLSCDGVINTFTCWDTRYVTERKFLDFIPDIVISFGGNIMSGVKEMLKRNCGKFEHWSIQEDGRIVDMFMSLTTVFECSPEYFFSYANQNSDETQKNDRTYYNEIKSYADSIVYPEFEYSNVYVIKNIVESIPSDSMLHLAINGAIRITNYSMLKPNIKVYANIGTHGIDGCMSSFLGQASVRSALSFLVIGDLAFFYDMNSIRIRHLGKNLRILLINNQGGEEFYYNGMWQDEASDLHTTARHHTKAEGWVKECGIKYIAVHCKDELEAAKQVFFDEAYDRPVLIEAFTEMAHDSKVLYDFYALSKPVDMKQKSKEVIKGVIGQEAAKKLKNMFNK